MTMTMRETFAATAAALLDEDPKLAVVLADISVQLFDDARTRHPDRVVNVGIREQLMISVAAGMALSGMRPIAHSYAPFLVERPFEQVKLALGHQDLGAVLVSMGASYDWAAGGHTHHGPGDVALLDTLPGWTVHVPGHRDEAAALLRSAAASDGRVYIRLSAQENAQARLVTDGPAPGGGMHVVRRGGGATVVAVGPMLDRVVQAASGLDLTVLYAPTVRPFDAATLRAVLTSPEVVLVEPYLAGTSLRQVAEALSDIPHRTLAVGVPQQPARLYGEPADHDRRYGLDVAGLRERLGRFVRGLEPATG